MNRIKTKLSVMNFLEFAIWGSYLTCMANYLGPHGLGEKIPLFYAMQGIVSIFMPAIIGVIADKYVQPQRLLGLCHALAAIFMGCAWWYGSTHPTLEFAPFFTLYTLSVAFFMPTIALANTTAFSILKRSGLDTIKDFPPIRVLGTVGFIAAMWFVNSFYVADGTFGFSLSNPLGEGSAYDPRFQYTVNQLLVCAILGLCLALYCLTLPECPLTGNVAENKNQKKTLAQMLGFDALRLFKTRKMAIFFIFSMFLGVSLQITNGYATPFITSYLPEFPDSFAAQNATLLTSLSQISEAFCILLIPFCLRRFGIKNVMLMAMGAWVLRFGLFSIGGPEFPGVLALILSMIVYGVAFDFFNVSGALFVERETSPEIQASAQGLFMLMTNGIGATVGMIAAGAVVNHFCHYEGNFMVGDWSNTWLIFSAYAAVVLVLFAICFKYKHQPQK
ncbi:MAG: MFS transporter [Muribaculaceae bacterium]|nr:MFS transporter [Muribaculaceae bacterium]